jgi:hypothetical protein
MPTPRTFVTSCNNMEGDWLTRLKTLRPSLLNR